LIENNKYKGKSITQPPCKNSKSLIHNFDLIVSFSIKIANNKINHILIIQIIGNIGSSHNDNKYIGNVK
jgi:hypothetical protein